MSKKHNHSQSQQEKPMEAPPEVTATVTADPAPQEAPELTMTAKQMAAAEEENSRRALEISKQQNQPPPPESPPLVELLDKGIDAIDEAMRAHNMRAQLPNYVPPPRTDRQMTQLEEELEAGRQAGMRAAEQQRVNQEARARAAAEERAKQGFTTPVHRPGDAVPDPTKPAPSGYVAGSGTFGPNV